MTIEAGDIVLRDFLAQDIEKRITWETTETEWQLWDAPWEYEGVSEEERQRELEQYIAKMHRWVERFRDLPDDVPRTQFQIATRAGEYIGWCSRYDIDKDCNFTQGGGYCTIGISIPELSACGKGYAYQALIAFIGYLRQQGVDDIYLQTWSGNERMIHIAQKMGFAEHRRKAGIRTVRGKSYDGLTFRLDPERYAAFCRERR